MANKISYIIQLKDQFGKTAQKIARSMQRVKANTDRASGAMTKLKMKMRGLGQEVDKLDAKSGIGLGAFSIAVGLGAAKLVKSSSTIEDAMADVSRVIDMSGDDLVNFENKLESMSEKMGKSKLGLAQMAFEGGKLGVPMKDMAAFLTLVSKTAISFDMMDQEAGRAIGSIQAKMGLTGDSAIELLDSVNYLADTTSASGAKMIEIIERVSGNFSLLKIPPQAAASLAGFANQIEVTEELAASGLNMFFARMQRFPGMTTKLMNDPLKTIQATLGKIAEMGPEVQAKFIRENFGDEAGRFVNKMVSKMELFDKTVENAFSVKATGSMTREFENQLKRSSNVFKRFAESTKNTFESIGDTIKPVFVDLANFFIPIIDGLGEFVKKYPAVAQYVAMFTIMAGVLAGIGAILLVIKLSLAIILSPIVLIGAAIAAVIAGVIVLWQNWDTLADKTSLYWAKFKFAAKSVFTELRNFFVPFANMVIDFFNVILKPYSMLADLAGLGKVEIPKLELMEMPKIEIMGPANYDFVGPERPVAPSTPVNNMNGNVNGSILVEATQGTAVKQTKMTNSPGMNIGMNMAY